MARETKRSGNERFKYGICLNEECPKCKAKEVQQIPMRKEFVCECGSELRECPPPKKGNNKLLLIIIAAIVVVGGIVAAILALGGKSEPVLLTLNKEQVELRVGECDTIVAIVEPAEIDIPVNWSSSDEAVVMVGTTGVVKAIGEGQATLIAMVTPKNGDTVSAKVAVTVIAPEVEDTIAVDSIESNPVTTIEEKQPKTVTEQPKEKSSKPKASKLDLGYATYEPMEGASGIKDGKPNGNGIMRFKSRQTIPGTVDCVAEPGEWVNGMWRDGKVNVGTWYRNDGNQVIVKLGQRYNK